MNPVEIVALDALDLLVVVDNESDTLSSMDKGVPQLPELGRLVARVPHRAPIGLGLINMRERVHQLNGTFEFDSEPGRGTTVKADVPFRPAP